MAVELAAGADARYARAAQPLGVVRTVKGGRVSVFDEGNELYFRARDPAGALARYELVPEGDPAYATAQRYIGHNIFGREWGRWAEGLPYVEEALRVAPEDPKVLEDAGRVYAAVGRVSDARRLLSQAGTPVAARALERLAYGA